MRVVAWWMGVMLAAHPALAWAQQAPGDAAQQGDTAAADDSGDDYADPADIVVTGRKPPGQVVGDIPPELQLDPGDIRAYGVDSIADLIDELAPETQSARGSGPPAILLNGKRISSFHEIRDLPTEAILRIDILPEQVALEYGFSADQKVVNIVLRRHFRSTTIDLRDKLATEGGSATPRARLGVVHITPDGRFNLNLDYQHTSKLLESERDIVGDPNDGADIARYRTLVPESREFSTNATYARTIFGNVSATLNGRLDYTDSADDLGRSPNADDPLQQTSQALSTHLGTTFNGDVGKWNWSVTGNYDRTGSKTFTDRAADGAVTSNYAHAITSTGELNMLATGSPFSLPAGKVSTSWHAGVSTSDFSSHSVRSGGVTDGAVARDVAEGRLNIDLPIANRARAVLAPLGDLSANLNVAAHRLSDFGTLTRLGYGVNWAPLEQVRTVVSWTDRHDAPTAQQLGNPMIATPGRRVFDYVTGETIDVTRISGGNRNLAADTRHVFEAELTLQPLSKADLRLIATYTAKRTVDAIATLPAPTAAIEAAFPDRFVRDAAGDLVSIDARPVNFAEQSEKTFRWGFNFTAKLKSKLQKQMEAYSAGEGENPLAGLHRHRDGGDGGHHRGGGRHGGFGGGRGGGGGRLQVAIYHTWKLEDTVRIRDGLPQLDLLDGDTIGSGGGESRHQIQGRLGYFNNGLGAQLRVNWQSGTRVEGGAAGAPEPLTFSPLTTLNLRLFADLGSQRQFARDHPWARGLRLSLSANNLLDSRQHVRDATGATPVRYQPDYLDPLGRTVMFSIRKLFFQRSTR
jgi:hypothetical protein